MTVGAIAAFALAELLGLAQGYWAVLTVVIVMQASVGGSLKATVERLVGTLGGAVLGGALAAILPLDDPFMLAAGLAAAILPLAFIAAVDPRFRVAPLTAVIVLLSPTGQQISPIFFTLERIGQIALGSAVALAVSLLVLPARAHNILAQATGRLIGLLADFFVLLLAGLTRPVDGAEVRRLQIATRRTIVQIETIAEEAQRERASRLTDDPDPDPILRTSLRMRSDMIMLARAAIEPLPAVVGERLQSAINGLAAGGRRLAARPVGGLRHARPAAAARQFRRGAAHAIAARSRPSGRTARCAPSPPSSSAASSPSASRSTSCARTRGTSPIAPRNSRGRVGRNSESVFRLLSSRSVSQVGGIRFAIPPYAVTRNRARSACSSSAWRAAMTSYSIGSTTQPRLSSYQARSATGTVNCSVHLSPGARATRANAFNSRGARSTDEPSADT